MRRRALARTGAVLLLTTGAALALVQEGGGQQEGSAILVTTVRGAITPVIEDHLHDAVARAESDGFAALVVELDTPGGLDTSMRGIVQSFLNSNVPVIVFVAPAGARAASAGAFVTMSAHVAAMAPATAIGAATPVDLGGGEIGDKVVNDAAAYAEALAQLRERDVEFAVDMVREGRSVPARQAVELGVVDLIAEDLVALLDQVDGMSVSVGLPPHQVILVTAGAPVVREELSGTRRILQWLADPNLAFLLLSIGTLAILYELANPGIGAAGIVGLLALIVGLFSLSVLPVNALGVILLVLAAGMFVGEVFTPGIGVFAVGGTVSLVLSGLFLFRGPVQVNLAIIVPIAAVVGAGTLFAGRLAWRARRAPATTGRGAIVGQVGTVRSTDGRGGEVMLDGVWWHAHSSAGSLEVGRRVRVVDMEGLELVVEPVDEQKGGEP
ncbi:MAG: NfeD family protein [Actinomycetota bacterium]